MTAADTSGPDVAAGPRRVLITPARAVVLFAAALAVLIADRALGLTALAVIPGIPVSTGPRLAPATLLADMVAALAVGGTLGLVELLGRPCSAARRRLVVLLAALMALQLGSSVAESVTGTTVGVDLFLGRALLLTGALLAARLVLASLVEHRTATQALRAATAQVEALEASGRVGLVRLREDVSARVRDVLGDAFEVLAERGGEGVGARLRGLAEDVLRPLSHRLAAAPTVGLEVPAAVDEPRWRDTLAVVARRPVVPSRMLATIAALLAFLRTLVTD